MTILNCQQKSKSLLPSLPKLRRKESPTKGEHRPDLLQRPPPRLEEVTRRIWETVTTRVESTTNWFQGTRATVARRYCAPWVNPTDFAMRPMSASIQTSHRRPLNAPRPELLRSRKGMTCLIRLTYNKFDVLSIINISDTSKEREGEDFWTIPLRNQFKSCQGWTRPLRTNWSEFL